MRIVGRTEDGLDCWAGLYKLYQERGLPLADQFKALEERGGIPSWPVLVDEAVAHGMERARAVRFVVSELRDSGAFVGKQAEISRRLA